MGLLDENPVRLPTPPPESPPPPPPAARRPPAKWWEVEDLDPVTAAFVAGRVHWRDYGWCRDFGVYVLNTHVLLSVCCAHPKHPMSRFRRLLMLLSSLCFAFFVCVALARFHVPVFGPALGLLAGFVQVWWDLIPVLMNALSCQNACLPVGCRRAANCFSFACLALHTVQSFVFALVGAVICVTAPAEDVEGVSEAVGQVVESKLVAFALALPISMVLFTFLRWCEVEGPCRLPPLSGVALL